MFVCDLGKPEVNSDLLSSDGHLFFEQSLTGTQGC